MSAHTKRCAAWWNYSKIKKAVHPDLIQNAPHKWEDICLPADSLAPASFTISIMIINFVFVEQTKTIINIIIDLV